MHFFIISLKSSIVYRWSVLVSIIGSILFIAINLLLWSFLYRDNLDMVSYMTKYTIISNIIAMFYTRGIAGRIGDKVATGAFVTDLIRPINIFSMSWQMELAGICSNLLLRGLPAIIVYLPFLIANAGYYNLAAVLCSIILGHVLFLLIYSLLGFAAFILIEIWPFGRLLDDTMRLLSGGFIPLAILPATIGTIAYALPFRFLYSFPLDLLLGKADMGKIFENFTILTAWIVAFAVLNFAMYRLALKKAVVQGG
jgi:ABC-2 type transport system permease protein